MHSVNHNKLSGEMHFEVVMFSVYISGSQPFKGQVSPTKIISKIFRVENGWKKVVVVVVVFISLYP